MNQPLSHYQEVGTLASKKVFKNGKFALLKAMLFVVSSQIGKLVFLSYPLFAMAECHIANQLKSLHEVHIDEAFADASKKDKYVKGVQIALIYHVVVIASLLLIGGLAFGLIMLGIAIDDRNGFSRNHLATTLLSIFSGVLVLMVLVSVHLYFSPMSFILQTNDDISLSDIFKQNQLMMSTGGRQKLFQLFRSYLINLLMVAFIFGIGLYLLKSIVDLSWFIIFIIILSLIYLVIYTRLTMTYQLAAHELFTHLLDEHAYEAVGDLAKEAILKTHMDKKIILLNLFNEVTKVEKNEIPSKKHPESRDEKMDEAIMQYEDK